MRPFTYTALPVRVVFDAPAAEALPREIERLGCRRALLISTSEQLGPVREVAARLGPLAVGVFGGAAMHTPVEVTEAAVTRVREAEADCLVAIGGGSTIGLAKAIALRTDLPQIAVPTTYAGSEATPILGQTEAGRKTTLRSPAVQPEVIIYNVSLTFTLPVKLSVTSGMNAIAHPVEALYAEDANPVISLLAEREIRALADALPRIAAVPADKAARADALFGAWACGTCLGAVGMSLHHKLCHVLGGSFDLPHSETHTIILPHVVDMLAPAIPEAYAAMGRALMTNDPAGRLFDLPSAFGAPTALRTLGLPFAALGQAVEQALEARYWTPVAVEASMIRRILENAWAGNRPVLRGGS